MTTAHARSTGHAEHDATERETFYAELRKLSMLSSARLASRGLASVQP